MVAMQLVAQRPDKARAPRQDGQLWLAALRALEEAQRELGTYVSPHHDAFVSAVNQGGGKAGRRRFRLWRENNDPNDSALASMTAPEIAARREGGSASARIWLTAALRVVARERPKLAAAVGAEEARQFAEGATAELEGMLADIGRMPGG